ncbi:SWI/SNF complex subunit SWI3C-like [Bidens hawaiensis]|uniref:SWI/SNF complex subunit SWI3C-like n=1 Tax=Bidens hawaiensis TaxID=980011 RepID=UPI0040494FFB
MPASSSDTKNRWRKRKRGDKPQRHHHEEDEDYEQEDEEEEEDLEVDHNNTHHPEFDDDPTNSSDPIPGAVAVGVGIGAETEVLSDGAVRISAFPSVVKQTVNWHHYSVTRVSARERACQSGDTSGGGLNYLFLENVSHGQLQALSAVPRDAPALTGGESEGSFVITPPQIMEGRGVVKRYGPNRVHVVPMHADWFSPTTVNRLERQAVPHFFSGKSPDHTPEKYMDCRNRIVAKYMENPAKRLSATDCHSFLAGVDPDDVTRVVRFLENWGVINYCVAPLNHNEPRNEESRLAEDSKGELRVPATALRSIDSLIQFDKPRCRLKASDIYPELGNDSEQNLDLDSRIREVLSENRCNYCSRSLGIVYYQSLKEIETFLCLSCFNEGAFVAGHSSLDFIKVDSTKDYGDLEADSWTNQETLLLLEAMELFNENWSEIADHVGTKSKAQCIHHFVRLSIDETPLESIEIPDASNLPNGNACGKPQSYANGKASVIEDEFEDRLPFEKSGNPVMSQVAFLASAVGPRVAAACAHASLAALSEDDRQGASENAGVVDGSASENRVNSENMNGRDGRNPSQQKVENSGGNNGTPLSSEKMRTAVRAGLAAAAIKAKLFADHEEREIQRLSANIINHQLKRLELKLKQFAEVESLLIKECEQLERGRQRIAAERALLFFSQFGPAGVTRPTGLPGAGPSMGNNNPGPSRQQVTASGSGSPAQPFISGFPGTQPMHPQMTQQPMFGLGPRLPLSAINPSTTASASHPMLRPVSGGRSGFE